MPNDAERFPSNIRQNSRGEDDVVFAFFVETVPDCLELMSAWVHKVTHCIVLTSDVTPEIHKRSHVSPHAVHCIALYGDEKHRLVGSI